MAERTVESRAEGRGSTAPAHSEGRREAGNSGHNSIVDAHIRGYFDTIDQENRMVVVERANLDRALRRVG
jgi:hypothetical protein